MNSDTITRRNVIAGIFALGAGTLGFQKMQNGPELVRVYTTTSIKRPIVDEGSSSNTVKPYLVDILSSKGEAESNFRTHLLPEYRRDAWTGIDYSDTIVAVFQSRYEVTSQEYSGTQPRSEIDGNTFTFTLDAGQVNTDNEVVFTQLELWSLNGEEKPEKAKLSLLFE